jgi:hypothetical protein
MYNRDVFVGSSEKKATVSIKTNYKKYPGIQAEKGEKKAF